MPTAPTNSRRLIFGPGSEQGIVQFQPNILEGVRTDLGQDTMSAFDPQSGHRLKLFDHGVGASHDGLRHYNAKRLSGFEVDNQFELSRLFDR